MTDSRVAFRKASWANVVLNALKIAVEGTLGLLTGSLALTADAAHSVADLLASVVVLRWGGTVYDDPDEVHPHGHDRFEPLSALFVGGVLVVLGLRLVYDAMQSLLSGVTVEYSLWLVGGLVFALVDMYVLYRYTKRINRELELPSLRALAADSLNDLYTTGAALVGVLGMAAGYPLFDPLAGGLVSLFVVKQGVEIARENVRYLADSAAPEAERDAIKAQILGHPMVHGVHDFVAYYSGPTIEVEVHVEVDADLTVVEAHDLESELRERVLEVEPVSDVHVHLDPAGTGEWVDESGPRPNGTDGRDQ